jgi:hypothetical protein
MPIVTATQKDLVAAGMWNAIASLVTSLGKKVITFDVMAASVNKHVFVADRAYEVELIKEIHSVVGGASANVKIRRITDTSAPGAAASATVVELVTAGIDLTTTINTTQTPTLVTGSTTRLAAGDKLSCLFAGTLTGLVGHVTVVLTPV